MQWRIPALVKAFRHPRTSLGDLDADSAAALIAAASDVCVILDSAAGIADLSFSSEELAGELPNAAEWPGRPFASTLSEDTRGKLDAMLTEARNRAAPKWRHLNHLTPAGASVPVLYCAVRFSGDGRSALFGRDLRAMSALQQRLVNAQQSMERDYLRMRDVEMRYRLLFQISGEAVLIVDAARLRVVEANPASRQLLAEHDDALVGRGLADLFDSASVASVQALLTAVRGGARAEDVAVRLAQGGAAATVAASMFRQENSAFYLLRVAPDSAGSRALSVIPSYKNELLRVVEHAPDGFVVTDSQARIVTANAAFLEMAQLASEELAHNEPLDRWLGQSSVDLNVLVANLRQRGSVRFFATTVRGEFGLSTEAEVSAVAVGNAGNPYYGFAIRNVGPRLRVETRAGRELPRSVEQLSELIGRVALKDLVREATDVIEKLCIEAALELTNDNRASAAEMLGLSRQSFYVKLRRYGLGDLATDGKN